MKRTAKSLVLAIACLVLAAIVAGIAMAKDVAREQTGNRDRAQDCLRAAPGDQARAGDLARKRDRDKVKEGACRAEAECCRPGESECAPKRLEEVSRENSRTRTRAMSGAPEEAGGVDEAREETRMRERAREETRARDGECAGSRATVETCK